MPDRGSDSTPAQLLAHMQGIAGHMVYLGTLTSPAPGTWVDNATAPAFNVPTGARLALQPVTNAAFVTTGRTAAQSSDATATQVPGNAFPEFICLLPDRTAQGETPAAGKIAIDGVVPGPTSAKVWQLV